MSLKDFFKPTKGKIITSVILTFLNFLFVRIFLNHQCKTCAEIITEFWPKIVPNCNCTTGANFSQFALDFFIVFIIPFLVAYLIYSLIIYLKKQKSKTL